MPSCEVCDIDYEYYGSVGYSREYCGAYCHGKARGREEALSTPDPKIKKMLDCIDYEIETKTNIYRALDPNKELERAALDTLGFLSIKLKAIAYSD